MEFKKLELESDKKGLKGLLSSPHFKRSLISIIVGAVVGFGLFYFSEGRTMDVLPAGKIIQSILIGGFFGFFITNSPCARNQC